MAIGSILLLPANDNPYGSGTVLRNQPGNVTEETPVGMYRTLASVPLPRPLPWNPR